MERFMLLRNYVKTDCAQLARLFYDTVHTVNAKAAPHNYVCGSQRIFCTSSAVSKTGNTYSIPSFLKLCTGTKSLAELPCQIMRCCPKDYTQEQLAAWATGKVNLEAWNESFQAHHTVVRRMGDPKSVRYRNGAAGSTGDFIRRWQTGSDCHRRKLGLEQ